MLTNRDYWLLCRKGSNRMLYPDGAKSLNSGSDTGYITQIDGEFIIVIDGTSSLHEWLENILVKKVAPYAAARGFSDPCLAFVDQIIKELGCHSSKVTVVGHSRGGAIAQIIALYLIDLGFGASVITFGSPRIGGMRFYSHCTQRRLKHLRIYIENDVVCNLPKNRWFSGFMHYQTAVVALPHIKGMSIKTRHLSYGERL